MTRLSSAQQTVIDACTSNLIVHAVPGAGKTEALLGSAERLIEDGLADPQQLQFITYDRSVSRDLQRRLQKVNMLRDCRVNTLHSLCLSLHDDLDVADQSQLSRATEKEVNRLILPPSLARALFLRENEYRSPSERTQPPDLQRLTEFLTLSAPNRPVTQTELLLWTLKRLRSPDHRTALNLGDWTTLIVDEAQDLTRLQWTIVLELARKSVAPGQPRLVVLGDLNQRLYDFQGAEHNFAAFLRRSGEAFEEINLNETWRCRGEIALLASSYLSHVDGSPHVMIPARGFGGHVSRPLLAPDQKALADLLESLRAEAHQAGHDLAVLTRTNHSAMDLLKVLPGSVPIRPDHRAARPAEWQLAAALRCSFGLSAPGGGHPLLQDGSHFDPMFNRKQRHEVHAAWELGKPSPDSRIRALEEQFMAARPRSSRDFAQVVLATFKAPADEALFSLADQYPAPERLLAALHARHQHHADQPTTYVGTIHAAKGQEWPEVALLLGESPWGREDTYVALTRARERLHLIAHKAGTTQPLLKLAEQTRMHRESVRAALLGDILPSRPTMLSYLADPILGPYLRHHWPRHTSLTTLRAWQTSLLDHAPEQWNNVQEDEPDDTWRKEVTILKDYLGV